MKIGFLVSDLNHRSGWSHYSLSLLQALKRTGVEMTVITAQNSPDVGGLPIYKLLPNLAPAQRFNLFRMMALVPKVRALLSDCDLIHVTAEPYVPLGAWIAGKRPMILTGHGSYVHVNDFRRWPINAVYRQAFYRAHMVCVSHYTERVAQGVLPGLKTTVVNNGVDAERFAHLERVTSPPDPLSIAIERGRNTKTILTVGGVKGRKGTLELVRAVSAVRQQIPDIQCIVIGSTDAEPKYTAKVREEIAALGLQDTVKLLGFVPENVLMDWYAKADLFVLPSMNIGWKFEGYGLAHIEASAAGLPVIGTTDCGAEDAIEHGITGLLVPQAQVTEKLPPAIIELLTDTERAAKMGAAGREKAKRQSWDFVARQMMDVYNASL